MSDVWVCTWLLSSYGARVGVEHIERQEVNDVKNDPTAGAVITPRGDCNAGLSG